MIQLLMRIIKMKYREIKKLIGVVATASVLSACGSTTGQDTIVQNNNSEVTSTEATTLQSEVQDVVTKATVTYEQSDTDADELNIINNEPQDYIVKDYNRPIFFKYLTTLDYDYTYDADTNSLIHDNTIVSDNVELVEDDSIVIDGVDSDSEFKPIIYAKDCVIGDARPIVKYLKVSDTEAEAKYISLVPSDSKLVSGITFEFRYDYVVDVYKMTAILGVFGEDLSRLETYEGVFDFYSDSVDGDEYCKPGDTVSIKSDTSLFPHFIEDETALLADKDGLVPDGGLETIDGQTVLRIIHVNHTKDGKTTIDYALSGLDTEKDTVKNTDGTDIDKETVTKQQTDESNGSGSGENGSSSNGSDSKSDNGKGNGDSSKSDSDKENGSGSNGSDSKSDNGKGNGDSSKSGGESGSNSNGGGTTNGSDGSANSEANKNQTGAQSQVTEGEQTATRESLQNNPWGLPVGTGNPENVCDSAHYISGE